MLLCQLFLPARCPSNLKCCYLLCKCAKKGGFWPSLLGLSPCLGFVCSDPLQVVWLTFLMSLVQEQKAKFTTISQIQTVKWNGLNCP